MRLLHTADWHLGRRLFGIDRLTEAGDVLDEVREVAAREAVDAVLVAGDVLDRRIVEPDVLAACLRAFEGLAEVAPLVVVTGNHDDPAFWLPLARYLAPRVLVRSAVLPPGEAVETLDLPAGPLHVAALPWPDPARLPVPIAQVAGAAHGSYADLVAGLVDGYADALRERRNADGGAAVLLAHLMVEHARAGGGERELTLGQTYAVKSGRLPVDLDYLALGHVHKPQPLPGLPAPGRYAGSPMQLDFGEAADAPEVTVVETDGRGPARARSVPLAAGRRLVRLRGAMDDLPALAAARPGAWFHCEVELDRVVPDLVRAVRDLVPDALRVEPRYAPAPSGEPGGEDAPVGDGPERAVAEHYADWYRLSGRPLDPRQAAALDLALRDAAEGE